MEADIFQSPVMLIICVIAAILVGFFAGSRKSRHDRRELQRAYNKQSLDMLDVKSDFRKLQQSMSQTKRKDQVLRMALEKFSASSKQVTLLNAKMQKLEKLHFIETSQMRLTAAQSQERVTKAATMVAQLRRQLKRVEQASPATQTINAPPPKSYGQAAAVPVRVVDQHLPEVQQDSIVRVSNRDSVRLTRLNSSNESTRFHSDKIRTTILNQVNPNVEQKLNKAGITHVEQLNNMSDSDISALRLQIEPDSTDSNIEWKDRAQKFIE